jgi:hypothetical protein
MKKHRFIILKHIQRSGNFYYTCKIQIIHPLVWSVKGFGLWLKNFEVKTLNLGENGSSYHMIETTFESKSLVLQSIDLYMDRREKEDSLEIVSVETEIIWR